MILLLLESLEDIVNLYNLNKLLKYNYNQLLIFRIKIVNLAWLNLMNRLQ